MRITNDEIEKIRLNFSPVCKQGGQNTSMVTKIKFLRLQKLQNCPKLPHMYCSSNTVAVNVETTQDLALFLTFSQEIHVSFH